jgi:hypothetical protein
VKKQAFSDLKNLTATALLQSPLSRILDSALFRSNTTTINESSCAIRTRAIIRSSIPLSTAVQAVSSGVISSGRKNVNTLRT